MTQEIKGPVAILEVSPASRVENAPDVDDTESMVEEDLSQPRLIPLESFPFRIGRGNENQASIQDKGMSRRSIEIRNADGQLELIDLGQHSGVLVNGEPLDSQQTLQFDDVITFPNADLKVTLRKPPRQTHPKQPIAELQTYSAAWRSTIDRNALSR